MNKKTEQFIKKALLKHNGLYSYENVEYVAPYEHVNITCKNHGVFSQTPNAHLRGRGCIKCSKINNGKKKRLTFDEFKHNILKINPNITFDNTVYINTRTKIELYCTKHKKEFTINPANALFSKHVCPYCAIDNTKKPRISKEQIIKKLKTIYTNNEINFYTIKYNGWYNNAIVECNKHGFNEVSVSALYNKRYCKKCMMETQGFDCKKKFINNKNTINEKCFIYKRKIDNFYKIGIARNGSKSRTGVPYDNITEIFNIENTRLNCWILEQKIIAYNTRLFGKFTPDKKFSGSKECFSTIETPFENNISNYELWKEVDLYFNTIKDEILKTVE